jgi:hypothetical protein
VRVGEVSEVGSDSPFSPYIRLYGPTGALIEHNSGTLVAEVAVTAPSIGTYTVVVTSFNPDAIGSYLVTLAKGLESYIVPSGDQGGPLTNDIRHNADLHRGDLDQWTFAAPAGRSVRITVARLLPGNLMPWIRLYGPNGVYLTQESGTLFAQISVTIPITGRYRVVVSSSSVAVETGGSYFISADGVDACCPPNPTLNDVVLDLGPGNGLFMRVNPASSTAPWVQLHRLSPTRVVRGDVDGNGTTDVIAAFAGSGVWIWESDKGWLPLHPSDVTDIAVANLVGKGADEIILNFPGVGLWARSRDLTWRQLHPANPVALATGNVDGDSGRRADLIVSFPGAGVWIFLNNTNWLPLHGLDAAHIQTGDLDGSGQDDIIVDFPGWGVWVLMNMTSWHQLSLRDSTVMTVGNLDGDVQRRQDLVIAFPGAGTWAFFNNSSWSNLHVRDGSQLAAADLDNSGKDDLLVDFPGDGVWLYWNNASYQQLTPSEAEVIAPGRSLQPTTSRPYGDR